MRHWQLWAPLRSSYCSHCPKGPAGSAKAKYTGQADADLPRAPGWLCLCWAEPGLQLDPLTSHACSLGPVFCWCPGWSPRVLTFDSILTRTRQPPLLFTRVHHVPTREWIEAIKGVGTHDRSSNFRVSFTTFLHPHLIDGQTEAGRRRYWPKFHE